MSDLLALAELLKAKGPEGIAPYLPSGPQIHDLLDLAKVLLTKRELERRIRALPAAELDHLKMGRATEALRESLLAADSVFEDAKALAAELKPIPLQINLQAGHGAGLSAYQTLLAMTELLFSFEKRLLTPVKAGLRAPDAREIGDTLKLSGPELQLVYQLGLACGLIHQAHDRIHATKKGFDWLELDTYERWLVLATKVLDLPSMQLDSSPVLEQLLSNYPLLDPNQSLVLQFGELLGLTENLSPTPELLKLSGIWISAQLPQTSERFVVQGDLSLMTLGPISAKLHRLLDVIAQAEDLGLASRFRLSNLTLSHALESGMREGDIREVLGKSIQPLPQPVEYLITETVARFGSIKIYDVGSGSLIRCDDQILLRQIQGEQALRPLMFEHRGEGLVSRLDSEIVYLNLRACGYAAVRMDDQERVLSPRAGAFELESFEPDLIEMATAIFNKEAQEPSGDDVTRQLQFALRNKLKVAIRVSYPDGSEKEHLIEPLGIAGNRVRGRDTAKEAEITLPLGRISAIWLA